LKDDCEDEEEDGGGGGDIPFKRHFTISGAHKKLR
jgi:hypothetical protein